MFGRDWRAILTMLNFSNSVSKRTISQAGYRSTNPYITLTARPNPNIASRISAVSPSGPQSARVARSLLRLASMWIV
jgi:hypothetical protein